MAITGLRENKENGRGGGNGSSGSYKGIKKMKGKDQMNCCKLHFCKKHGHSVFDPEKTKLCSRANTGSFWRGDPPCEVLGACRSIPSYKT